ncbi:MAG: aldo/keto reductase [Lachnospiraceae bacterium]|nr:aldo/keto reductase [Lachnospiraceae bacterium]
MDLSENGIKMKYKKCGNSGLKMPALSLGLWHSFGNRGDFNRQKEIIFRAFDLGINCFDLANNYGPPYGAAETNFGKVMKEIKSHRDEMLITTKAGFDMWPGPYGDHGSGKYLTASLDQSLKRMGLDHVDIYYHHRPDPETPLEETCRALDSLVRAGKTLYVGVSNYNKEQTDAALKIFKRLGTPFVVNQSRFSLLDRKIERTGLLSYVNDRGLGLVTFSPLAQGLLTGKYLGSVPSDSRVMTDGRYLTAADAENPELREKVKALCEIALSRGQTPAQMALSWVLSHEAVTGVIIGASSAGQLTENLAALENTGFTAEELEKINKITIKN